MKALVFAAGLGTRLRPLTDSMPKALVPLCGEPLLHYVLEKLSAAGCDNFVVNVHHFPDAIIDYLKKEARPGRRIAISDERDFLRETGGGIRFARALLEGDGGFYVHNVDIISDADLAWLRRQARPEAISTILVSERQTKRYFLFDEDMRLCGWTNVESGEVRSPYGDKLDLSKCRKLAFSGIHWMSDAIFEAFDKEKAGDRFSVTDFYVSVCDRYPIYGACPEGLKMMDVGKAGCISEAEALLKELL